MGFLAASGLLGGCSQDCTRWNGKTDRIDKTALRPAGIYAAEGAQLDMRGDGTAILRIAEGKDVYTFTYRVAPSGPTETYEHVAD